MSTIDWNQIDRGSTQKGVNRAILKFLLSYFQTKKLEFLLDVPCGKGEFLNTIKKIFPDSEIEGYDLFATPLPEIKNFFKTSDIKTIFSEHDGNKCDVITCISGVMVFDHVSSFIENASRHLKPDGWLIITNDNVITVRDRLSFLFLGRLRRFKLIYSRDEDIWNVVLIQALWKHLQQNGFNNIKVQYTSCYLEDFIFLPLAILIYPYWWLAIYLTKGEMDVETRKKLFPFIALLARHYVIYAQKK